MRSGIGWGLGFQCALLTCALAVCKVAPGASTTGGKAGNAGNAGNAGSAGLGGRGGGTGGGGGTGVGGGGAGGGGAGGGGGAPVDSAWLADVVLQNLYGPGASFSASAAFQGPFAPGLDAYIVKTTTVAGAKVQVYTAKDPAGLAAIPPSENGGAIVIDAAGADGGAVALTENANQYSAYVSGAIAQPGDPMTVKVNGAVNPGGGTVSKFTTEVPAPGSAIVDQPVEPPPPDGGFSSTLVVDSKKPFTVAAHGGTKPANLVAVLTGTADASSTSITQITGTFPLVNGSGSFTFDPALLALLPKGPGGTIQIYAGFEKTLLDGPYTVTVKATTSVSATPGGPAVFVADSLTVE